MKRCKKKMGRPPKTTETKSVTFSINMEKSLNLALIRKSGELGITKGELVRIALGDWLSKNGGS